MKAFFSAFFLIILLLVLGGAWFWRLQPNIPFERTLTDSKGRALKCRVIGKSGNDLVIERLPTKQRDNLSTTTLRTVDRYFFKMIGDAQAPPVKTIGSGPKSAGNSFAKRRMGEIKELQAKITFKRKEIASDTLDVSVVGARERQITALEKEIRSLKLDIETHLWQSGR